MKKLIALLLVICMVAGLFIGCKKKTNDPVTDPTATEATGATEATEATEALDATGSADATETPDATEAPEETEDASGNKKPTAASRPKKTTATSAAEGNTSTKATQAAATKATEGATKATTAVNSPYKGKTIEIYGMGSNDSYQDFDDMIEKESTQVYPYIERAAMVEWAELNGVTLDFKGKYDQNTVMSAINAGDKPDVIGHTNVFPGISNNGLTAAFTTAEYKKLAEICGEEYLDLLTYGTKSHGFIKPWTGTMMCYYNATLFEEYGVKTPKEYFLEGNWTWDTFLQVMIAMTKDTDGDSKMDSYGLNGDSWGNLVNPWATNSKGELISTIDEPWMKAFFQLKYDAYTVKKCTIAGKMNIQSNVMNPLFAMQLSDCEPYNFQHLYQETPNGNVIEVAPVPEWRGDNGETLGTSKLTQACWSMAATCDEREAVIDMFCYLLKCGFKYVSDYSLGTVDCEYEGLQGSCEYSKKCLEALEKINKNRTKKLEALGDTYDSAYVAKLNKYLEERGHYIYGTYTDVPLLTSYSEITQMAPESAIPQIKTKYQNALDTYNNLYMK